MAPARRQLRDEAAAYIRELISAAEVHPGALLRLAPLAESLDMSATPVREALLLLSHEGWVVQEPNRGFRVTVPLHKDVEDAYLVLGFLSGELAARAAKTASAADIADLRQLDEELLANPEDDGPRAQELNTAIHARIADIADSPRLQTFVTITTRYVPRRFWYVVPGWDAFNKAAHGPIINAIEAGSGKTAAKLMSSHISEAAKLLLEHLDATDFWTAVS